MENFIFCALSAPLYLLSSVAQCRFTLTHLSPMITPENVRRPPLFGCIVVGYGTFCPVLSSLLCFCRLATLKQTQTILRGTAKAYVGFCQASMVELFCENSSQLKTKGPIINILQVPKYVCATLLKNSLIK